MLGTWRAAWFAALASALGMLSPAAAADKVVFGTNWKAQAEHGGFYQALAKGIYARYGLDVTIRPGGPTVNHPQLLAAGKIDFNMGGTSFGAVNYVAAGIPVVTVASMFQKDPQVLIAHEGEGVTDLASLKGRPIMISTAARNEYWQWLKGTYGFTDDQIRTYTFNPAPFLADPKAVQQGYVSSEPYALAKAGAKTHVLLLADAGYSSYSTTIEVRQDLVDKNPDLVQRFVDASILGWQDYLNGDPSPGNALIKADNPEMTDDQIAYSIKAMKEYGIVESGDALTLGIGAMTDSRWKTFFDFAAKAGVYPADLDYRKAYTLRFVNKGVGLK
jgi:NitT/TauT family transport system substrate-binding protein